MKKLMPLVVVVVVVFVGYWMFTDPQRLAGLHQGRGQLGWDLATQPVRRADRLPQRAVRLGRSLVLAWLRRLIPDPEIRKHLLRDEGEVIVDEVPHHWIVYTCRRPRGPGGAARRLHPVPGLAGRARAGSRSCSPWRSWPTPATSRSRAHGPLRGDQHAGVPRAWGVQPAARHDAAGAHPGHLGRVKPLHGRLLGYGHFTFENAAQAQGLRDIQYVARPDERDLTIQRVVQRAGLRGPRVN